MADDAITITVRIMGREYTVSCPPEEHETLVASAELLNERMSAIRRRGKALGTERIAVMAALNLARELLAGGDSKEDRAARERASERIKQLRLDIDSTIARHS
ncbi:cell division protein ZapA [Algiphilus sp. NNCM1]|nr:cell division protein ZapA [Algiphilus acroporae]